MRLAPLGLALLLGACTTTFDEKPSEGDEALEGADETEDSGRFNTDTGSDLEAPDPGGNDDDDGGDPTGDTGAGGGFPWDGDTGTTPPPAGDTGDSGQDPLLARLPRARMPWFRPAAGDAPVFEFP